MGLFLRVANERGRERMRERVRMEEGGEEIGAGGCIQVGYSGG